MPERQGSDCTRKQVLIPLPKNGQFSKNCPFSFAIWHILRTTRSFFLSFSIKIRYLCDNEISTSVARNRQINPTKLQTLDRFYLDKL